MESLFSTVLRKPDFNLHRTFRKLELVSALGIVLLAVSFGVEYNNEMNWLEADSLVAKTTKPPLNCGADARLLDELDWFDWLKHRMDDRSAEQCAAWLRRVNRSTFPAPMPILTRVLAQLIGEPLRVLFDAVGHGLRSILAQHNLLLQFGLLFAVAAVFVLSLKVCLYSKVFGRVFRPEQQLPYYCSAEQPAKLLPVKLLH